MGVFVQMSMTMRLALAVVLIIYATPVLAADDGELRGALERRFNDDRTGACVAAAIVDGASTSTAYYCANPADQRSYDDHTAFEIGSVTKTMTAALLAQLIEHGELKLGDPLSRLLPPGTPVPSFNGVPITIAHIVTHTSGLPSFPSQWRGMSTSNPYGTITENDLLDALAGTILMRPPGAQWEYSNFAMMVLSYGLAKRSGKDFEMLLRDDLLGPLDMRDTFISRPRAGIRRAQGHLSTGTATGAWDFPTDMAGVGGVRSTLRDMIRYMEGELGTRPAAITSAMALTQQQVAALPGHTMGMNWIILPGREGRTFRIHEGATGGFSSFVGFDRQSKRAVVLLSDTALSALGGLGALGLHLLDPVVLAGSPHVIATPDPKLIKALVGRYRLKTGLGAELRAKGDVLSVQADRQPEFEMGYDSAGDFYPLQFDAILRPRRKADGTYALTWFQGGAAIEVERIGPSPKPTTWTVTEAQLKEFEGTYALSQAFSLKVFSSGTTLLFQGTGQPSAEASAVDVDTFVADKAAAEITFKRDVEGTVRYLTLRQRGQVFYGERSLP